MKDLLLSFQMIQAAAIASPEGFTIDKNTFEPITAGYSVAVKETQNSFGNYGAAKVVSFAAKNDNINALGGWLNTDNNEFYYDAVIVCSTLEEAIRIGRENGQIAVFDLNKLEEVRL